jgi:hypothetical protein
MFGDGESFGHVAVMRIRGQTRRQNYWLASRSVVHFTISRDIIPCLFRGSMEAAVHEGP